MALVRLLRDLMKDKEIGQRIVPIAPDEYRTFGMDSMFPTAKVYNPMGQRYESVDRKMLLAYKESEQGQMLHEGISEAGAMASATAAGSAYSTHGEHMIPFYLFYSMFGFQRTGDSIWAMADQLARGFLIGATAGRTTLTGEGLQHADGHSPLLAATNPAVVHYDPAMAYEVSHIIQDGLRRMYGASEGHPDGENVIYYMTVYNEPTVQPKEPDEPRRRGAAARASTTSPYPPDGPERRQPRGCSCSPPASASRGSPTRRGCSPRTGASPPTPGRSRRGTSSARDARRRRGVEPAAPLRAGPGALRHRQAQGGRGPGRGGERLHARRAEPDRQVGARATTTPSAPTASASPTPVPPPGGSSTSTPSRSSSRPSRPSPSAARSSPRSSRRRSTSTASTTRPRCVGSSRRAATPERSDGVRALLLAPHSARSRSRGRAGHEFARSASDEALGRPTATRTLERNASTPTRHQHAVRPRQRRVGPTGRPARQSHAGQAISAWRTGVTAAGTGTLPAVLEQRAPAAAVVRRRRVGPDELVDDLHEPLRVVLVREVAGVRDHLDGGAGRELGGDRRRA